VSDDGPQPGAGAPGETAGNGRRAPKSPEAFRTISEVADELNLPQHVLRFWESKFSQIRPLKRGGGRRYYRPEDVDLLRRIRRLLYTEGYTIKGVQKVLRENGARQAVELAPPRPERVEPAPPAAVEQAAPAAAPAATGDKVLVERGELERLMAELVELRDLLRRGRR
jgi:DNA-binding transcriptional MerR regulator